MSLIQEALKRKDDENAGVPPKAIPVIPPVVPPVVPLPVAKPTEIPMKVSIPPAKEKPGGAWSVLLVSMLVITTLVLVAVGLMLWKITQGGQQASKVNVAIESPAQPVAVPEPVVAAVPEPVRAPPPPVLKPVEPAIQAAPVAKAAGPAPIAGEPVVFSISTGVVKEGATEKKPAPAEVSVVPVSRPMVSQSLWPTLKVVGVMAPRSAAQSASAIIDGNLVESGDEIRGVRVRAVDKTGVWFEFRSQTQFVRVGQTTL
jgi:hypothetical protein